MSFPCPQGCPGGFASGAELYDHLRGTHSFSHEQAQRLAQRGGGWYEQQVGGVAQEHQEAALKAKIKAVKVAH